MPVLVSWYISVCRTNSWFSKPRGCERLLKADSASKPFFLREECTSQNFAKKNGKSRHNSKLLKLTSKSTKTKDGGFGGFVKHLVKHKIIILILLIICSSWAMFCCNQKSDCQKSIFPGCSCAEHWDAPKDLEAGHLCLQREEVLPAHHHHSEQVDFEEEVENEMTLFS